MASGTKNSRYFMEEEGDMVDHLTWILMSYLEILVWHSPGKEGMISDGD